MIRGTRWCTTHGSSIWTAGRTSAPECGCSPATHARVGGRHAGRRHHELHKRDELQRIAADDETGHLRERRASRRGALHAARRETIRTDSPSRIRRPGRGLGRANRRSIVGRVQSTSTRATRGTTGSPTSSVQPAPPSCNAPRIPQRVDERVPRRSHSRLAARRELGVEVGSLRRGATVRPGLAVHVGFPRRNQRPQPSGDVLSLIGEVVPLSDIFRQVKHVTLRPRRRAVSMIPDAPPPV